MAVPLFHLEVKQPDKNQHHYYRTLLALHNDKAGILGISLSYLQKHDFANDYDNDKVTIRKGSVLNSAEVEKEKSAMAKAIQGK